MPARGGNPESFESKHLQIGGEAIQAFDISDLQSKKKIKNRAIKEQVRTDNSNEESVWH